MKMNIAQKIILKHLLSGEMKTGKEVAISIDQTLTQDATGTMAFLQFEALGIPRVKTKLSISYIDHNTLQTGFENADDHRFLQSAATKYGAYFSRPGNGICHQVHLERFGVPGATLIGSDSHTPTGGALGMLAIGAGGLDVAVAMAGGPFYLTMPKIVLVNLTGKLKPWVVAKDIILELLRRLTVKGGVGKIFEFGGTGVAGLTVPERATITNMGAELGATTSLFPSDAETRRFLKSQDREKSWRALKSDPGCHYDSVIDIDLGALEPMIAKPHQPDQVVTVRKIEGLKVDQVLVGSCTNSSYKDLMTLAAILKGKKVHPLISAGVAPGSRQVLEMLGRNGALADLIAAGVRIFESACGACIGMGQAPASGAVTLRTFNRNFQGRSGTADAQIYLASPEVAAAAILTGQITDPRKLGKAPKIALPKKMVIDDGMIIPPTRSGQKIQIVRGANIKPLPLASKMPTDLKGQILLKVSDNITTDHIMPAGAKILPLRSNLPAISQYVFAPIDPTFAERAKNAGGGFILSGENYGQGSSREHAALAPMYLGIKAVVAKSFARIHMANLINFGILPLTLANPQDYARLKQNDELEFSDIRGQLQPGAEIVVRNITRKKNFAVRHALTQRQIMVVLAGGTLNYFKYNKK
ncbi:MAG: aconitate hydratase [Candidatus Moranbacteria bacterium CG_4_9_14_3_um_filter_42_9]|nr:MAG: aconitate hydratase [Candidatus Moranbacteria bacterium CG_4_9_14_3_um_filter_42_9]